MQKEVFDRDTIELVTGASMLVVLVVILSVLGQYLT